MVGWEKGNDFVPLPFAIFELISEVLSRYKVIRIKYILLQIFLLFLCCLKDASSFILKETTCISSWVNAFYRKSICVFYHSIIAFLYLKKYD